MIETLVSSRIAQLEKEIQAGNCDALAAFWEEVKQNGAPLLERLDNGEVLVTFLYQAEECVGDNHVIGGPINFDLDAGRMIRLPDTDVWYRTIQTKPLVPTRYYLSLNDTYGTDWKTRQANLQPDPLNPHRVVFHSNPDHADDKDTTVSVLQFPCQPMTPLLLPQEGRAQGQLDTHKITSNILNNERHVWVYTPPGYAPDGEPYHLLVLHDGKAYWDVFQLPTVMENLLADGQIPPFVAVMVNSNAERHIELPCNEQYANFLVQEVLPFVKERYHVTSDPSQVIISGFSFGGLASMFAAYKYPDVFGNVLSQSGSFWWSSDHPELLVELFNETERLPINIYMDYGTLENPALKSANDKMLHILQEKGYQVHFATFEGGHDLICWRETIIDGLLALTEKK